MPSFVRVELDGHRFFSNTIFPKKEKEGFQSYAVPLPSLAWRAVVSCANDDSYSRVVVWNSNLVSPIENDEERLQALRKQVIVSKVLRNEEALPVVLADDSHVLTLAFRHMVLMTPDTRLTALQLRAR